MTIRCVVSRCFLFSSPEPAATSFILLINKQGQTRLSQYFEHCPLEERRVLEAEIVRKCLARSERQCSFVEHREHKARVCNAATRVSCRSLFLCLVSRV